MDGIWKLTSLKLLIFWLSSVFGELSLNNSSPEQIHISYGGSHDCMVVMWSSRDEVNWKVHYGMIPIVMEFSEESKMATLPESNFKAAKYIYRSELKNLTLGETYFYKIVAENDNGIGEQSSVFSFKTLPAEHENGTVSRFVVYGDMGARMSSPTRTAIETLTRKDAVNAILHIGDFAYDLHTNGGLVGDTFMNEIQHLAANIPYMTAPGNHEIAQNFEPYRTRFSTPNTAWPIPLNKMWYSFDVGLVHFISYSTEVYFTDEEKYVCPQFHWLLQDLIEANQNRDKRPWVIAMGHRPMYCSNDDGDDCTDPILRQFVKAGLEPLFNAQGVDMVIEAHEHSYERLYPIYDGKVERFNYIDPRAPVHIISGAAGSAEGINGWSDSPKYWSAFRSSKKNYKSFGVLEVHNTTHLFFSQNNAEDNSTKDEFWMIKNNHGPFVENVNCSLEYPHESCKCHMPLIEFHRMVAILSLVGALFGVGIIICGVRFVMRRLHIARGWNESCRAHCMKLKSNGNAKDGDTELLLDGEDI